MLTIKKGYLTMKNNDVCIYLNLILAVYLN